MKHCINIRCTKLRSKVHRDNHDSSSKPVQIFKILSDSRKSDLASMTDRSITIKRKPWLYIEFERILRNRAHHMEFLFHYYHSSAVERFEMSELKTQSIRIVFVHICLMRHLGVREFDKIEAIVTYP